MREPHTRASWARAVGSRRTIQHRRDRIRERLMRLQPGPPPVALRDGQSRRLREHYRAMMPTPNLCGTR